MALEGYGLFSGQPVKVNIHPAPPNTGIVFVRSSEGREVRIPARVDRVVMASHRTAIAAEGCRVEMIEHLMAALAGLGLDNIEVRLDADELPGFDGSSARWCDALIPAGRVEQDALRQVHVITEPVAVQEGQASIVALPSETAGMALLYELDYGAGPIGHQLTTFHAGRDDFPSKIATARSFATEPEARALQAAGVATHLTAAEFLVIGENGPIDNAFRFPDECARHKLLDLLGDLYLIGGPIQGRIVANRSGHALNHKLVRQFIAQGERQALIDTLTAKPKLDIRQIMRILPHRFPMLMVDRVVELQEDRRAVGIKNVTMNELHFLGHYPGQPIMPGVLILEAMAQLGGLLLSRRLEHTGKLAVLLSMDGVKLRRPVLPGDQLVLIAESVHVRTRTGHVRCTASVAGERAAEAEIKFMLVDADPV